MAEIEADEISTSSQVIVRVLAIDPENKSVLSTPTSVTIQNPRSTDTSSKLTYKFSLVASAPFKSTRDEIFDPIKKQLKQVLNGKNLTIYAYGQSGSGKTYTVCGNLQDPGIMPLTLEYFLQESVKITATCSFEEIELSIGYLEIYNEKIYDLLSPSKGLVELRETAVQNSKDKEIKCVPMISAHIKTMNEFHDLHKSALKRRKCGKTNLNETSSRSHFILQLLVTCKSRIEASKGVFQQVIKTGKVYIIDLAGCEDNKRSGNEGERMVESSSINTSLFVLGKVVEALNTNSTRIPYRDSKITRLLQDSIGGTAISTMIATCSTKPIDLWDTYNTLNFAVKSTVCQEKSRKNEIVRVNVVHKIEDVDRKGILEKWKMERGSTVNIPSSISNKGKGTPVFNSSFKSLLRKKERELTPSANILGARRVLINNSLAPLELITTKLDTACKISDLNDLENEFQPQSDIQRMITQTKTRILEIINNGTEREICALKMIGTKRCLDIINGRSDEGFASMDALSRVGFKPALIQTILQANIDFKSNNM